MFVWKCAGYVRTIFSTIEWSKLMLGVNVCVYCQIDSINYSTNTFHFCEPCIPQGDSR